MSDPVHSRFRGVVEEYAQLEPDGTDTWNPLGRDGEMLHRMMLYEQLCRALRRVEDADRLRVLDVGCGNGRSTRVYLDFGLRPDQLTGVDLRSGAIEMARRSHPGIHYLAYDGRTLPVEDASMNWISICTVMSSIPGLEARRHLADEIGRALAPGGMIFYWDRARAKAFAGGESLEPLRLFPSMSLISDERVRVDGCFPRYFPGTAWRRTLLGLARRGAALETHRASLLKKPDR